MQPSLSWAPWRDHRTALLRFARRRLRDAALAEDVVQEVLVAVVAGEARFDQRSSLQTWLTSILRHKIVDAVRRERGDVSLDAMSDGEDGAAPPPADSADPSVTAEQRQALSRALARLQELPVSQRCAFERHVLLGESGAEVCRALDITPSNLWVRVHRARRALLVA
jgi:RNA polymerase sigma-70 factor (ECF subfamily)